MIENPINTKNGSKIMEATKAAYPGGEFRLAKVCNVGDREAEGYEIAQHPEKKQPLVCGPDGCQQTVLMVKLKPELPPKDLSENVEEIVYEQPKETAKPKAAKPKADKGKA